MRTHRLAIPIATMVLSLAAATGWAGTLSGTVKMGGIFLDEDGDRSAVQETYDIYDGFALSRIQLAGSFTPQSLFNIDLRDINLDSRAGNLVYRVPGRFRMTADYDQSRYVFDPARAVTAERKDWRVGMRYTAIRWLSLSGDLNRTTRTGDRLGFPLGTISAFGDRYDNAFLTGRVSADVNGYRRGGGVAYEMSDYSDDVNSAADRRAHIVSARLYSPMPFYSNWTNLVRGSYGIRKSKDGDAEYKLSSFQYTSVMQPWSFYQFRYLFDANRVDDNVLELKTDRFINDFDMTWFHRFGHVNAGYAYETNDDDQTLTTYHSWHAGATLRPDATIKASVDYNGRVKKDQEDLTLLKDIEASSVIAKLDLMPVDGLGVGCDYRRRERDLTDIHVTVHGMIAGAYLRYDLPKWGSLSGNYSHAEDAYVDRYARFDTRSDIVTGRVDITRVPWVPNVNLAGGVTYLDIGKDLDIEKSLVFMEGALKVAQRYHLEVKYNVYNYDDYILLDRYYTANVVRVDLGYDL